MFEVGILQKSGVYTVWESGSVQKQVQRGFRTLREYVEVIVERVIEPFHRKFWGILQRDSTEEVYLIFLGRKHKRTKKRNSLG